MRYNPALDGLRAIAVLAVIEYHSTYHALGWHGYLGVDVFFVLSGFLISSILLREEAAGGIRLGAFYLRRARRLYPALCVLVTLGLALGWTGWQGAANALLYLGDYGSPAGALAHTWSLAVEEHYYLLWPLLLPFLARLPRERAVVLLLAVYVAATAWSALSVDWLPYRAGYRFDTRMSGLVFGSMLAFLPIRSKLPLVVLGVASVLIMAGYSQNRAFAEAATGAIILLSYRMELPFLTRPLFTYLGRLSYGMYLFHYPLEWAARGMDLRGPEGLAFTVTMSIACAALSYHTVEAYFRRPRAVSYSETQPQAA